MNVQRKNKEERKKRMKIGEVNWQKNEDLYVMKYVVRYLCS
jgi:hypothetical protein